MNSDIKVFCIQTHTIRVRVLYMYWLFHALLLHKGILYDFVSVRHNMKRWNSWIAIMVNIEVQY